MVTVRRRRTRLAPVLHGLTAGSLLAAAALVGVPATALAQGGCGQGPQEGQTIADTPWAEEWFDLGRLSPPPRADGVRVAVIDTGVEDSHPQLEGQVEPGQDLVVQPGPDGRTDCNGHGTAVASIIAATEADGIAFAGLAPGATILPYRVTVREVEPGGGDGEPPRIPPEPVARAITLATEAGAQIINVSLAFPVDHENIRQATEEALARGVIVVAAAGNKDDDGEDVVAFPANIDGVVSVGAIMRDGSRFAAETYVGPGVDLLAPGAEITVAWADGRHSIQSGTSFAAPFVSAAAALVLAGEPDLTGPEVVERLIATADPGPGSATSYAPVVNPYRALTGRVAGGEPVAVPPPSEGPPDPAAVARAERWERDTQRAVIIMVIALSLTIIGLIGASVWRRGELHGWRPGQRRDPVFPHPIADEPEREFYTVPTPRQRR